MHGPWTHNLLLDSCIGLSCLGFVSASPQIVLTWCSLIGRCAELKMCGCSCMVGAMLSSSLGSHFTCLKQA